MPAVCVSLFLAALPTTFAAIVLQGAIEYLFPGGSLANHATANLTDVSDHACYAATTFMDTGHRSVVWSGEPYGADDDLACCRIVFVAYILQ